VEKNKIAEESKMALIERYYFANLEKVRTDIEVHYGVYGSSNQESKKRKRKKLD